MIKELEYSKEEILEKTIFDFVIDEEMNQALTALRRLKDKGRITRHNIFRIKKKSGEFTYLEVSGIPFKLKNNSHVILGIGHDITLLKETEKELKISEKKYRNLFNDSPIGIMLFDLNGNLIDRNLAIVKGFPEYLGINLDGKNFKQILAFFINSEQLMKVFMERLNALRKGEPLEPYEFFIITKDRRRVWINWQSSLVKVNNEKFIQVLLQNITERKETEQMFQVLFNNSTSGIAYHKIVYDSNSNPIDYVITDVNPQYEKLLPFKREDVINKKATEIYQVKSAPYIDIYSRVANTQVSTSFEAEFPPLEKYFKISVISPKKGEFITVFDDLSERKRAEDVVKVERDKLQAMMDGLTRAEIGIDIVDINYNVLFQNQFLKDRFGDISTEYCYKKYMGLSQPCEFCPMEMAIKNNAVETTEIIGNDGRGYQLISAPLPNPDGTIDKVIEVVLDITNRKRAEQKLKESEEKFRIITEQSFLGIIIIQDNMIKYANEATTKITEYSTEELVGMSMDYLGENFFHPEDLPLLRDRIMLRRRSGEDSVPPYSSYRAFTKSGELRWIEDYSKVILYRGKEAVLTSIWDITEKKDAEQKLRESEEIFRIITEQSFMGIIILQDNQIKYANEALAKMTEYSTEELEGMSIDFIRGKIIPVEDLDILIKRFRLRRDGDSSIEPYITYRIITKSGNLKWVEHYSKIISIQGLNTLLVSIKDITEKKEAERLIIEENKKLLELDEMRKEMITRISHELKTPLTSIYGAIQILSESLRDQMNDNVLKFVDVIHRGSIRFKKLIENLLDISRMDSRKLELNSQQEDLSEIVNECVNEMIYLANNRNLTINLNLPHELLFELDKLRMEQAITNLISNAIKNTPMNGLISISLLDYKEFIDIKIEDTGVGLTPEEKLKLFKKFGKIERYGMDLDVDIEGIGLGLFISKEIVELHGGKILVESEGRNMGSTFTIRLFKN